MARSLRVVRRSQKGWESANLAAMRRPASFVVLGLSAAGFPLTQLVIRHWGRRGGLLVEAVCGGLLVRDAVLIASGAPRRLRSTPATLLWCEAAAAAAAVATGLPLLWGRGQSVIVETARRAAVGTLFGLHTLRFGIYSQPDRGLRPKIASQLTKAG